MDALREMELQEVEQKQQEGFRVNSLEAASWVMRKLASHKAKAEEINELAAVEISRIKAWQEKEISAIANSVEYFEIILKQYYSEEKLKDNRYKLSTPYGKVTCRKQPDKWEYDEELILEQLKKNNVTELIRTKEEINKAELKKRICIDVNDLYIDKETGLILDGIKVIPQGDKITVEVEG